MFCAGQQAPFSLVLRAAKPRARMGAEQVILELSTAFAHFCGLLASCEGQNLLAR